MPVKNRGPKEASEDSLGMGDQPKEPVAPSGQNPSRSILHARELLSHVSEGRMDRIARIKAAVENGTYEVHSREIARKMVDEALRDIAAQLYNRKS